MQAFQESFSQAFRLLFQADSTLLEIVVLSLNVSFSATFLACLFGMPFGALLATREFPGKWVLTVIINTLMGMPPVVLGLLVYMLLSGSGPFGWMQLLYTPRAMIIVQFLLVLPIVTALTRQIVEESWREYREQFRSWCVPRFTAVRTLLWDTRGALLTAALAGFARAISEVGAVILVGGNINHVTRVMTTAIALETSKGELALALALGMILLTIALTVNALVYSFRLRTI